MAKAKIIGETSGSHLKVTHYDDGTVKMKWNWNALLKDVQIATGDRKVTYVEVPPELAEKLVTATEKKVTKTRAKKSSTPKK